jgi:two-component system cell cycle sensor histidine kinase/response regulator CckA
MGAWETLFDVTDFPARWHCGAWTPAHGWVHIVADLVTWLAYMTIPLVIVGFVRRKPELEVPRVAWLFAAFIFSCGLVHLLEAVIFWHPLYRLAAVWKVVTALASVATVAALIKTVPRLLTLQGSAQLARELQEQIDARARKREALRRSQEELQRIFDLSLDLLCEMDIEGRFLKVNEAFTRTLGYAPEALLGRMLREFIHPDDMQGRQERLEALARGETLFDFQAQFRDVEGRWRWLWWRAHVIAINGVIYATARDVTEQREREEAQREREAALQEAQRLESLGLLAGGVAHDFNNLLAVILGNAGLARLQLPEGHEGHDHLDQIERASERAADLCRQMLAYAGRSMVARKVIDLSALVQEMSDLLRVSLSPNTRLEVDLPGDLPRVEADASQLRQVVLNLLTNANEATRAQGGAIWLTTCTAWLDPSDPDLIPLGSTPPPGQYLCLEIQDEGVGMSAEVRQRAFEPFFTTRFVGRGLGLAAVHGVVRTHQGAIQLQSAEGVGTTIRIYLPYPEGLDMQPPATTPPALKSWSGEGLVLVVDDEPMVLEMAARLVESLGFRALRARSGEEALALFDAQGAGLAAALLDLTMPGMDGAELFGRLKARRASLPILISSGYSAQEVEARFQAAPPDGFVQKPYLLKDLRDALHAVITPATRSPQA